MIYHVTKYKWKRDTFCERWAKDFSCHFNHVIVFVEHVLGLAFSHEKNCSYREVEQVTKGWDGESNIAITGLMKECPASAVKQDTSEKTGFNWIKIISLVYF